MTNVYALQLVRSFTVQAGEVLDFMANVTTDDATPANWLRIELWNDDGRLVSAVDDSNEGFVNREVGNDDNLSLSLLYKEKVA